MKKNMKKFIAAIAFGAVLFGPSQQINAGFNFGVQPVMPDNQIDRSHNFFNLQLDPGANQQVEIILSNPTESDLTVEARLPLPPPTSPVSLNMAPEMWRPTLACVFLWRIL